MFRRTIKMSLINCEINCILTWSANCAIFEGERSTITNTKFYVPVLTLSTNDSAKLSQQLK